ncbi:hypothetical protein HS125_17995 [bacterium]|nr:hypothetical protein [bacterium]
MTGGLLLSLGIDNGGITTLDQDHRGLCRVVCLNRTEYLAGSECEGGAARCATTSPSP